jgi:peptidoglycan/LPS O-acetylase OafA/YrhL
MNRRTLAGDRRRRKLITALWSLGVAAVVITLIYLEKTAILYILCTVSIAVLLMIVAFSDLAHGEARGQQTSQTGDASGVAGER